MRSPDPHSDRGRPRPRSVHAAAPAKPAVEFRILGPLLVLVDGEPVRLGRSREQRVLALCYYEELTLKEVGELLGVTESRISQIRQQALRRLTGLLRD